jgi:hypothetical protein
MLRLISSLIIVIMLCGNVLAGQIVDVTLSGCSQAGEYMKCKCVLDNNTDIPISFVSINFRFKNSKGAVIGYDNTNMVDVGPNTFGVTDIYVDNVNVNEFKTYDWSIGRIQ